MTAHSTLTKTLFISFLGHIVVFGVFNLTFGKMFPKAQYSSVVFFGQLLYSSQTNPKSEDSPIRHVNAIKIRLKNEAFIKRPSTTAQKEASKGQIFPPSFYLKPQAQAVFSMKKKAFTVRLEMPAFFSQRKEPSIIFHPFLPHSFPLYFKDRQVAHVELSFNIASSGRSNPTMIKRKISSGNLEVDLLASRYISRYFSIQKTQFAQDKWQTVKIDFSRKND